MFKFLSVFLHVSGYTDKKLKLDLIFFSMVGF